MHYFRSVARRTLSSGYATRGTQQRFCGAAREEEEEELVEEEHTVVGGRGKEALMEHRAGINGNETNQSPAGRKNT